ncbi:DUF4336 domain-containing protein [Chelativorans sp.]|uniref:DUF4336 domain-containing protein n=1 Tax=Chelativorans sp. TaxID=2203393 RepID=UPI0028126945|nr:DUF4336 domain-containing protein [Chelativorans sp.]
MTLGGSDAATYPPLDVPKPVAPGIWIVDSGPLKLMGVRLPVRMTVMQLRSGGLILHSPTRFDPALRQKLEQIGPIEHLVAPNSAHWTFMKDWQDRLPNVLAWAAPGLRERAQVRRSGLRLDHDLGPEPPQVWSEEIEQVPVEGIGGFTEIAFFHKSSRTLVLTDLIENFEPGKLPLLAKPVARLLGIAAPAGRAPIYLRAVVRLKGRQPREAAERLVAFRPDRVIFAHGSWFERDGTARLRNSLAWLLP